MERSYEDEIRFLNTKAANVFRDGKFKNVNVVNFKKNLLYAMNVIENVFKGTFHSDLFVARTDEQKFEELFPTGFRLFNRNIGQLAHFLDTVRNCFAHAFLSRKDLTILNYYFSTLDKETKFNDDICYTTSDGKLTVAGLIFLIFNFLREQSIQKICKDDIIFGIIACGKDERCDGVRFIHDISHVDLEGHPIRQIKGDDIKTALLGEYLYALNDKNEFALSFGSPNNPIFHVSGLMDGNTVTIKGDSLTNVLYINDYVIHIEYVDGFIELANQLPELLIIDILKENGYKVFDKECYGKLKNKWGLISKLNYPKYYEDKNIRTIFIPNEIADYRIMNSLINNAVSTICISLEKEIYKKYHVKNDDYSIFRHALEMVIKNDDSINQIVALRNFAIHGVPWGEYRTAYQKVYCHSVDFVFKTIKLLLDELQKNDADMFTLTANSVSDKLIKKICGFRYAQANKESITFLNDYENYRSNDAMAKALLYVNHSMFDTNVLDDINSLCGEKTYEYKIEIPYLRKTLYLEAGNYSDKLINAFCANNGFTKIEKGNDTTLKTIELMKSDN